MKKRGLMIQAPMGTGKSHYIKNKVPTNKQNIFLDGDELLTSLHIKNRNYFWYSSDRTKEQNDIIDTFRSYLNDGYFILYSGNPLIMDTDVIVYPDPIERKKRVSDPNRFNPSTEQFDREEKAYISAIEKIKQDNTNRPTVIKGDIPDVEVLEKTRDNMYM